MIKVYLKSELVRRYILLPNDRLARLKELSKGILRYGHLNEYKLLCIQKYINMLVKEVQKTSKGIYK